LFKRFSPQNQAAAEALSQARAETYVGQSFNPPPRGESGHFKDFSPKRPGQSASPKVKPTQPPDLTPPAAAGSDKTKSEKNDLGSHPPNRAEPSLGYLFTPFDPGKPTSQGFEASHALAEKTYEFSQLDVKDERIVNTLERAEKKAQEMLVAAERQREELQDQAKKRWELEAKELRQQGLSQAEEVKKKAEVEAERILAAAQVNAEELGKARERTQSYEAEIEKLKAELQAAQDKLATQDIDIKAREEELAKRTSAFDQEKEKWAEDAAKEKLAATEAGKKEGLALGQAQGHAEGLAKGQTEGRQLALEKVKGLMAALAKVNDLWPGLWEANGPFMVELAVEAAEAMVNREIENGQGLATGAFKACVGYLSQAHEALFRICPADLAELEAAQAETRSLMDGLVKIKFIPDPTLGPGDLIMEADVGRLDATMKTRREKVMTVLNQALAQGFTEAGAKPSPPTSSAAPSPESSPGS
jgi:flagellar biosynthesis/type III secretory pathway protein FliH